MLSTRYQLFQATIVDVNVQGLRVRSAGMEIAWVLRGEPRMGTMNRIDAGMWRSGLRQRFFELSAFLPRDFLRALIELYAA